MVKMVVCFHSDSDSDADSFYGTIERPMDLKHPLETTDDGRNIIRPGYVIT